MTNTEIISTIKEEITFTKIRLSSYRSLTQSDYKNKLKALTDLLKRIESEKKVKRLNN